MIASRVCGIGEFLAVRVRCGPGEVRLQFASIPEPCRCTRHSARNAGSRPTRAEAHRSVAGRRATGTGKAAELLGVLQGGGRPNPLGRALAEYGRIAKTIYLLAYLDRSYVGFPPGIVGIPGRKPSFWP